MKRLTLFLVLAACGGAQMAGGPADDVAGSTGPGMVDDCPYALEDSCIDEAALAACQNAAAQCAGHVHVMESCPLQFSCGGGASEEDPDDSLRPPNDTTLVPCTEGATRSEDCNTCTCDDGVMMCTEMDCG